MLSQLVCGSSLPCISQTGGRCSLPDVNLTELLHVLTFTFDTDLVPADGLKFALPNECGVVDLFD